MEPRFNRREFIQTSAALSGTIAAGALAACHAGFAANERITMAVIGVGGMGTGHVGALVKRAQTDNVRVAAVADVYQRRVTRAKSLCGGEGYLDYRRILDRNDLDAVLIATPDHWHAKIAIEALESGKHVYVEKPMTHTIEQALALRDTVRRTGKVLQVGPQGTSNDSFWKARAAIAEGRIGKVTWAHASYNRNARICLFNEHQKIDSTAGPDKTGEDYIDWNMWLGHAWDLAPKIAWNPEHFFRFRKYFPYNGGVATDLLYHKLAPLLLAIAGPEGQYPRRVTAAGGLYVEKDGRDIPDTFLMTVDYPSEFSVFLASTLTNDAGIPDRIYGKHGTMELAGEPQLAFNGDFKPEFQAANGGQERAVLALEPRRDQMGNFLDVIRNGGQLHCNVELGAATMVAIKMAVEAYRRSQTLLWDAASERMTTA
jgi:predicted dehydrogenase